MNNHVTFSGCPPFFWQPFISNTGPYAHQAMELPLPLPLLVNMIQSKNKHLSSISLHASYLQSH